MQQLYLDRTRLICYVTATQMLIFFITSGFIVIQSIVKRNNKQKF